MGDSIMGNAKDWVPLFSQLVWPLFILVLLWSFSDQVKGLLGRVDQAIGEGRAVAVGDWLKIGEKTSIADLSSQRAADVGGDIDLSMESVGGYQDFVEKSSYGVLERLRTQLHDAPTQRIDVLLVTAGKKYSTKLLSSYVSTLGIRFIVFQQQKQFDGWMDAGLFNSQLPTRDSAWTYQKLHEELIGIRRDSVLPSASAVEVLKAIDQSNSENIAVVDDGRFRFIANRGNILSKLLTATLFKDAS